MEKLFKAVAFHVGELITLDVQRYPISRGYWCPAQTHFDTAASLLTELPKLPDVPGMSMRNSLQHACVVILVCPVCVCCDDWENSISAALELRKQGFLGPIVAAEMGSEEIHGVVWEGEPFVPVLGMSPSRRFTVQHALMGRQSAKELLRIAATAGQHCIAR